MKVIDLLNKIANGEEVPKKLKLYDDLFVWVDNKNDWYNIENRVFFLQYNFPYSLNNEIEIIEDKPNKIEKITRKPNKVYKSVIVNKINEIIEKLNNME